MRNGVFGCEVSLRIQAFSYLTRGLTFLDRSAVHTSPLITKSVLALGDQWLLYWVCVGELNEREY